MCKKSERIYFNKFFRLDFLINNKTKLDFTVEVVSHKHSQ